MNRVIKRSSTFILGTTSLFGCLLLLSSSVYAYNGKKRIIEAEAAKGIGGVNRGAESRQTFYQHY